MWPAARLLPTSLLLGLALAQQPTPTGTGTANSAAGASAPKGAPAPTGTIAFARGGRVLAIDVATGRETELVAANDYDRPLHWLATGERLLYWNHAGGAWDLWAVTADGGRRTNLTANARDNRSPASSPDGTRIAFHRGGDGLWVMRADGSEPRRLDPRGHRDAPPAWSPSGHRLAFTHLESLPEDRVRMVVVQLDLRNDEVAAARELGDGEAAAFLAEDRLLVEGWSRGRHELIVVDLAAGTQQPLTDSPARDGRAALSPDRATIAWIEQREAGSVLRAMRSDGSAARDLAPIADAYAPPSFSPDGRFVAFETGDRRDTIDVWIVGCDGGAARRLTTGGGRFPVWRPRARGSR